MGKKNDLDQAVGRAILYIAENVEQQPSLLEVARHAGLSQHHFQRLFQRRVGVSPKRFLQFLTVEHAKQLLERSESVLETTYAVGLSGPGRLHDHFISLEAVTPGEYKSRGEGIEIRYGRCDSPFGQAFLATTSRGICRLAFPGEEVDAIDGEVEDLDRQWANASLRADPELAARLGRRIFTRPSNKTDRTQPLALLVRGTNFQVKVWRALLEIPPGMLQSYEQVGRAVGCERGARAVGQAVGSNPVSYLIPCHRVVRKAGALGGYGWGLARKRAMIAWESAS